MTEHTVKSYGEELNHLTAEVTRMGGLAEAQVADAIDCSRPPRRAPGPAGGRPATSGSTPCRPTSSARRFKLIALRQPMAVDLRHAVAALKISMSLERCGDMAKNIGKRALILTEADPMTALTRSIERMGKPGPGPPEGRAGRLHRLGPAARASASGAATRRWTSTTTPSSANC